MRLLLQNNCFAIYRFMCIQSFNHSGGREKTKQTTFLAQHASSLAVACKRSDYEMLWKSHHKRQKHGFSKIHRAVLLSGKCAQVDLTLQVSVLKMSLLGSLSRWQAAVHNHSPVFRVEAKQWWLLETRQEDSRAWGKTAGLRMDGVQSRNRLWDCSSSIPWEVRNLGVAEGLRKT